MSNLNSKFKKILTSVKPAHYFLIALAFAAAISFLGLNARELERSDESRVAGIGTEMALYGNWVSPKLNGRPFLEKPPLYFWATATSIKLFGRTLLAARLPSALFGLMGLLGVFWLVRKMGYSDFAALLSLVVLATSAQYWDNSRQCMIDIMLASFIIFAMLAFFNLEKNHGSRSKILWYVIFVMSLGGAIFTKGLVGLAIPGVALFFWILAGIIMNEDTKLLFSKAKHEDSPKPNLIKTLSLSSWLNLFSASILCFIPVSIWLYFLYHSDGYEALKTVVWTNNFGRFTGGHAEHVEPFYYYFKKMGEQMQPWTCILPFALLGHIIQVFRQKDKNPLYLLCWLLIPYLLLMIAAGKRQVYVLPLYAAEAMIIGTFIAMIIEGKIQLPQRITQKVDLSLIIKSFAVILTIVLLITPFIFSVISFKIGHSIRYALAPIFLLIFGLSALYWMLKKNVGYSALSLLFGLAALYIVLDIAVLGPFSSRVSYKNIFAFCQQEQAGKTVCLYLPQERMRGAAVFYLGEKVPQFDKQEFKEKYNEFNDSQLFISRAGCFNDLKRVEKIKLFTVKRKKFVIFKVTKE